MDIVVWLRSLGLGKYEAAFRVGKARMLIGASTPFPYFYTRREF